MCVEFFFQFCFEEDDIDDGVQGNFEVDDDGYVVDIQYFNEMNQGWDCFVVRLVVKISFVFCYFFIFKLFQLIQQYEVYCCRCL